MRWLLLTLLCASAAVAWAAEKQKLYAPLRLWTRIEFTRPCKQVAPDQMSCDKVIVTFGGVEASATPPERETLPVALDRVRIAPKAAQ